MRSLDALGTRMGQFILIKKHMQLTWIAAATQQIQSSAAHPCCCVQCRQHLECIALVHQELLALGAVVHLLGVTAHKRVEERGELLLLQRHSRAIPDGQNTTPRKGVEITLKMLASTQRSCAAQTCCLLNTPGWLWSELVAHHNAWTGLLNE